MKKLCALAILLLASKAACALPLGNPSDASLLCNSIFRGTSCNPSFRFGFYGDYVYNRQLESDDHAKIDGATFFTNAAFLAFNFCNRVDLFATVGTTKMCVDASTVIGITDELSLPGPGLKANFINEGATDLSWSFGGRGTLWRRKNTSLGTEVQYFHTNPHIQRVRVLNVLLYPSPESTADWHEWQVGLGIAHRIHFLVPYAGVTWSSGKLNLSNLDLPDLQTGKLWGYALGVSLIAHEQASITTEVRFASETAFYLNGQVRF